jgi:uncharacterized protein
VPPGTPPPHPYPHPMPLIHRPRSTMPAGAPYHRLARTAGHRWWKPLVGSLLLVPVLVVCVLVAFTGFLVAALVAGVPIVESETRMFGDPAWDSAFMLAFLGAAVPAVLVATRVMRGRPAGAISSVAGRLRFGLLMRAFLAAVPAFAVVLVAVAGLETLMGGPQPLEFTGWVGWRRFLGGVAVVVLLVPFQAAAEEYLLRGWVLQMFGAWMRTPWPGIVVGAVAFAFAHGLSEVSGFVALTWFGIVFGWLAIRTGGLEAGIAYHTANNLIAFVFAAAFGGIGALGDASAADAGWGLFAAEAVVLPLYALVVLWLHRRGGYRATSAEPESGSGAVPGPASVPGSLPGSAPGSPPVSGSAPGPSGAQPLPGRTSPTS